MEVPLMVINENKHFINFHSRLALLDSKNNKKIEVETNPIIRQIESADIIQVKKNSKCRFLHCSGSRLYILDLGLNCVYILFQNLG